jgi:aryl-phospho-beta-D-glucosidase BglC (GH1 family)
MAYNNGNNSNSNNTNGGMVRLGGLWKNTTKDGKTYLAGTFGGARVLIFPNGFKEKDTDPDFVLNLAQNQPKEDKPQAARQPETDLF